MNPALLLAILLGTTLVALLLSAGRRRRQRDAVRRLAGEWRLNFGGADTLQLTPRVARHFPVPGAAALRVCNVIYGIDGDAYRYVFTAEYTAGVTGGKRRLARVAAFEEPRDRRRGGEISMTLADESLDLIEQYRSLRAVGSGS